MNQSIPDYIHYREFALAHLGTTSFYQNTETPLASNVDQDPQYGFTFAAEMANDAGVAVHRPIFTGQGIGIGMMNEPEMA